MNEDSPAPGSRWRELAGAVPEDLHALQLELRKASHKDEPLARVEAERDRLAAELLGLLQVVDPVPLIGHIACLLSGNDRDAIARFGVEGDVP